MGRKRPDYVFFRDFEVKLGISRMPGLLWLRIFFRIGNFSDPEVI